MQPIGKKFLFRIVQPRVPLGQLRRKPALGTPLPLMHEIYARSLAFMEQSVGPDVLPREYVRASQFIDLPTEM
ncbi:MAG: hypothetical protein ACRD25_02290, partial [Terracidiphilus sp.]